VELDSIHATCPIGICFNPRVEMYCSIPKENFRIPHQQNVFMAPLKFMEQTILLSPYCCRCAAAKLMGVPICKMSRTQALGWRIPRQAGEAAAREGSLSVCTLIMSARHSAIRFTGTRRRRPSRAGECAGPTGPGTCGRETSRDPLTWHGTDKLDG
jgi:hypothetical protein